MAKSKKAKQQQVSDEAAQQAQAVKDMARLIELEGEAATAEAEMQECHEAYKDARTSFEAAQTRIREFIRDCRDAEKNYPLLHVQQAAATAGGGEGSDGWKDVPLDQVIQEQKVVGLLKAEGVTTLGAYCDWRAAKAGDGGHYEPLLTFKGIGQAKADKVADQVIAWWAQAKVDHPRWGEDPKETKSDDQKTEP